MIHEVTAKDRRIGFLIFGFLVTCYLLSYTGVIQSSDGLALFATAESIVRRGELDMNQLLWMDLQQGSYGLDGELYSRKGLGTTLLLVPLVWVARLRSGLGLVHVALLLNPLLTAWTGALLYRAGCRLGWPRGVAMATSLIFGLATLAWPYTQTLFSEPLVGWGMLAALYGLLTFRQTGRKRYLMVAGVAWGLAYLARTLNLLTLPIFLAGLIVVMMRQARAWSRNRRYPVAWSFLVRNWRPIASFLIPVVLAGLVSLWWNWVRYSSIWETGYAETERFVTGLSPWVSGVVGLLVGPARGILWYSPVLLLALPGAYWFWRNRPWILGTIGAVVLLYVLVYGRWYMWHGGFSWGPRFLVPLLPMLTLLVGPVLWWVADDERRVRGRVLWQGVVGALIALSIGVQWLGMLIPFGLVQDWLAATVQPLFAPETFTQVRYSPLLLQWQFLDTENVMLAWWRREVDAGLFDPLSLLLTMAGVVVGALLLVRQWRQAESIPVGRPTTGLYSIALMLLTAALLLRYQSTLVDDELRQVVRQIEQQSEAGDAILHLVPEESQKLANVYHGRLPVYGVMQQSVLRAEDEILLTTLRQTRQRLWVLPDDARPEASAWEQPLRADEYLVADERPMRADGRRLALYALSAAYPLAETGLGALFGYADAVNEPVTEATGWTNLRGYALTTEVNPGDAILLALRWQVLRPVSYDYHVFVHLLRADGARIAQRDGQPVQWMRPTSSWQPGEQITDHYALRLPADAEPGLYTIGVGLYDPVSGARLPVSAGSGEYALELGPIEVQATE